MTKDTQDSNPPSDEHLLLARILERQRDTTARKEVDTVLSSGVPVREKLEQIIEIDRRYAGSSDDGIDTDFDHIGRGDRRAPSGTLRTSDAEDHASLARHAALTAIGQDVYAPPEREERRRIARSRARLKAVPVVSSFWEYFFRQRRKIREFQKRTQFLRFSVFGFTVRINPDARARVNEWIDREIPPLLDALGPIVSEGWLTLTKREYNCIRLLQDIALSIGDGGIPRHAGDTRGSDTRYSSIERSVLVLHTLDGDGSQIVAAIDRFYSGNKRSDTPDLRRINATIRVLLDEDQSPYGLAGYIRAVNIVATGRYLTLGDLRIPESDNLVPTEYFDCSAEVGSQIKEYLETVVTRIHAIAQRLHELSRIELYSNERDHDSEELQHHTLWQFAQDVADRTGRAVDRRVEDETNILARTSALVEAVQRDISPILDGLTPLAGGVTVVVFSEQCFGSEVGRIHRIFNELEKVRYDLPSFPVERFFRIHRKTEEPSVRERQAVDLIVEFAAIMVRIAKRLVAFTGNRIEKAGGADTVLMPFTPITFGKPFVAPEIEQLVVGETRFSGGSILDTLTEIAEFSLQIGRYFEEKTILSELRELSALRNELASLLVAVRRIATKDVYEAVHGIGTVD